jgi:hypothetical protein
LKKAKEKRRQAVALQKLRGFMHRLQFKLNVKGRPLVALSCEIQDCQ